MAINGELGVCVGRFQTPYLHDGHKAILDKVNSHSNGIVFVGVAATPVTKRNPMDFPTIRSMIQQYVGSHITILPIRDCQYDKTWSENLDKLIEPFVSPFQRVVLYHSRDSFKNHYSGRYLANCIEIATVGNYNATEIRRKLGKTVLETEQFRCGVNYAAHNMFPRVQPVVDVTVIDVNTGHVLLGRKTGSEKNCFIGGFVDMTDKNAEEAALRELEEETGIYVPGIADYKINYVCTQKINDWRDTESTSMMTTFFYVPVGNHASIQCKANDDIASLSWKKITDEDFLESMAHNHVSLAAKLLDIWNRNNF